MTIARLISPAARCSLIVAMGTALVAVPPIAGMGTAAIVAGVIIGVLTLSVGIASTAPEGPGTLPASVHADYDRGLAIGLLIAAVGFAVSGQVAAFALFGAAALTALVVAAFTRYAASPAY